MRLLIVTQKIDVKDHNLGFFHRWVEEFAKNAMQVTVIASFVGKYDFPENVDIYSLGKEVGANKLQRVYNFLRIFYRHCVKADAIFFHMIPEFVLASLPFIFFTKKPVGLWYVHKSVSPLLKIAERLVDFIFTASELSFRLPSKKVIYTGHAIDTNFFNINRSKELTSKEGIKIMTSGRISPVKDIETIIRACAILKNTWSQTWSFSVVGGPAMPRDHEYLSTLKRLVRDLGLEQYVNFLGARPYIETPQIYNEHDLFVSMSTTGSIDKAVLEAMSAGLTVLCANESFNNVLPFPYFVEKRSPELLAERIKALAHEARPNLKLREIVVRHHSLEKTISKIYNVISNGL